MRNIIKYIGFIIILFSISCIGSKTSEAPVSLLWLDNGKSNDTRYYDNVLILKNISNKSIADDWSIFFTQFPREIIEVNSDRVDIEVVNSNYFRVFPTDDFGTLEPGDSLIIMYRVSEDTPNVSQQPEGFYWVSSSSPDEENSPLPVRFEIEALSYMRQVEYSKAKEVFEYNEQFNLSGISLEDSDIIPSVKEVNRTEKNIIIPDEIALSFDDALSNEAKLLKEKLQSLYNIEVTETASYSLKLGLTDERSDLNNEWYELDIAENEIRIESSNSHGVFNGTQTLLALLKGNEPQRNLNCMHILDYPDLEHRGFMLDISRNFTTAENLKKMIDLLSSYKINVLHLHFSDDEGWRLQIPGLEELTDVGARRGHTIDEREWLYPGYDGSFDPLGSTSGNGYYTRDEFIDVLKYAAERHIRVVPEVESPGHARAAIVAMEARYNKYIELDKQKAEEYLLSDFDDTSVYVSAQSYTDNVMNVALPSTYRFMEKVISEIKQMYVDAGLDLPVIHIGGDEVPDGAWMESPACQELMVKEGLESKQDLFEYFYKHVIAFLNKMDIQFSGWQEVALYNSSGMDNQIIPSAAGINTWSTVPEWGDDEVPYKLANKGYPVILSNVNNFYMDLAYSNHYDERGHSWAGYVDESKSFSMLPYSIYRSSRTDIAGNPTNLDELEVGKEMLSPASRENILGVQAQLFAESIRGYEWVEYYIFPKIYGLLERGWNAHPEWEKMRGAEELEAFNNDLARFYTIISKKEFPYLSEQGINFRLANPGLKIIDGKLYANSIVEGASIHYTIDGSDPNLSSPRWKEPIECDDVLIKASVFYLDKQSLPTILVN